MYENEKNYYYDQYYDSQQSCLLFVIKLSPMWIISPEMSADSNLCVCLTLVPISGQNTTCPQREVIFSGVKKMVLSKILNHHVFK